MSQDRPKYEKSQSQRACLKVDFSHRLVDGNHSFIDSHGLMSDQTLGILHALAMQFERGESGVGELKALVRAHGGEK